MCHCLPLPASLSLIISSTIPFHPLPLSPSRRGRNLYLSQPGRVSTQQVREKQGEKEKERSSRAAAFPDRLLLRADSGAGLFQPWFSEPGGILALPEKDHIRQRFVSSLLSLFLCIRLFQLVVAEEGVSILMFFRGQDRGPSVPCVHRSSPEFSRAPSASGFIASIDSSSKYREIFTRRLVAFLSPSALFMLPLLVLDDCL